MFLASASENQSQSSGLIGNTNPDRYLPIYNRAMLGWYAEDGQTFLSVTACLLDISQQGVILVIPRGTLLGEELWLCITHPTLTDWVFAQAVYCEIRGRFTCKVTLRFDDLCPYDFFRAAVSGVPLGLYSVPNDD